MNYYLLIFVLFLKQIVAQMNYYEISMNSFNSGGSGVVGGGPQQGSLLDRNPLPRRCGNQKVKYRGKIIGGKEALLGDFPWMARLIYMDKDGTKRFTCGGFLIHRRYVLTAAHCIIFEGVEHYGQLFEVELGEHDVEKKEDCDLWDCSEPPQIIRVAEVFVHPGFDVTSNYSYHDIALIKLHDRARFTNYVQPICLLEQNVPLTNNKLWVSGWGKTENGVPSTKKLKVSVSMFNLTVCERFFRIYLKVPLNSQQFCAGGEKGKDSCLGDSGGPLMALLENNQWYAIGIVSMGLGCGIKGVPGLYANVTSYLDWIYQNIER